MDKFTTFGDLLRFLRRRVGLTQLELSIAVGYSSPQISRLELNLRLPDLPTIEARFVPALCLEDEPGAVTRLMDLAAAVRREDAPALGLCPYKGLDYFDEADAELFVGREGLTEKLVGKILSFVSSQGAEQGRLLAIVGASGSGKSSLVRAGLVPALRWNKTSAGWQIQVLTPTSHPLESLATALAQETDSLVAIASRMDDMAQERRTLSLYIKRVLKAANSPVLVLIIDQFEELFSLCRSEAEQSAFIDNLLYTADMQDGQTIVVITLRADFYAYCAGYPALRIALTQHQEYIGAMTDEEIRRAIEEPARRGHWEFEPGLVDLILHDVGHEPGALPLLSHALYETWQRRHGHIMALSGYVSAGGVRGAIAETAEAVFTDQFTPEQQAIARRIFIRLTELGDETATGDTRRQATISELILKPEETEATQAVLKALADARLVTTGEDSVQVAHEALIREWPTLRSWLEENREGLRLQRQLTEAAQEWQAAGREPDLLFRGARLAQVREWSAVHGDEMNILEREYLQACVVSSEEEAAEREASRQRELEAAQKLADTERQRAEEGMKSAIRLRRRSIVTTAMITLAVLLGIFAVFAWGQSSANASQRRSLMLANDALQASQSGRTDLGLVLALEAVNMKYPPVESVAALREVALGTGTRAILQGHSQEVRAITISPDNRLALLGSCAQLDSSGICTQGQLVLWDMQQLKELRYWPAHSGWVTGVAFSLDAQILVSGSEDGSLITWNTNGEKLRQLEGHSAGITSMVVAPTGSLLSGSADGKMILWGLKSGDLLQSYADTGSPISAISVAAGELSVVSAHQDGSLYLWNLFTPQPDHQFTNQRSSINSIAISPDGSWILSAESVPPDLYLQKIDRLTGTLLNQRIFACIQSRFAISSDGLSAIVSCQSTIYRVNLQNLEVERSFAESSVLITAITLSHDSQLTLAAFADGTLRLMNSGSLLNSQTQKIPADILKAMAITPDGKYLLVNDSLANHIEQPSLWDLNHQTTFRTIPSFRGVVSPGAVAVSPDGNMVAVAGFSVENNNLLGSVATVVVWNLGEGVLHCQIDAFSAQGRAVAFSPDSKFILAGSQDQATGSGQLALWNVDKCERMLQFDTTQDVTSIDFSEDGSLAITGSEFSGGVTLWDVATGKEIKHFSYVDHGPVLSVAFGSNDETILASGSADLYLWDVASGKLKQRYSGISSTPYSVAISPDDKYVLAGAMGGEVVLWDFDTAEQLRLTNTLQEVYDVVFSPDGKTAYAALRDGTLIVWNIDEKSLPELMEWIKTNRYARPFTAIEKQQYNIGP